MKRSLGFTLIEVLVSLSIVSVLYIAFIKTYTCLKARQSIINEQRNLLPYIDVFECFFRSVNEEQRCGTWCCVQDKITKERKFFQEKSNMSWDYKVGVTLKNDNWYEVVFFNKEKSLCKIYYNLKKDN